MSAPGCTGPKQAASEPLPVLSAEIFTIPLADSKFIIYAPLRRAAFLGNACVAEFIRRLRLGIYLPKFDLNESLLQLLRNLHMVEAAPEAFPAIRCSGEPRPTSITLFLTTACNLRCNYCYASAGTHKAKFMSLETAKRGIDFVAANAASRESRRMEVAYHGGGEPTLHWSVLTGSAAYAQRKAAEMSLCLQSQLATNGALSDEKIDWIIGNLNGANVSCDGLPSIQDKNRPTAAGNGSSTQVMHTLRRFDDAGFDYGIRLTLVAEHIPSLADSVEYLCGHFKAKSLQVEPVYLLGRGMGETSAETDGFVEAFRAAKQVAAAYGRQLIFSGARVGTITNHFCSVSQDNFCLSAEGNVTACHEAFAEDSPLAEVFFYGQPSSGPAGYRFNTKVLDHLRDQGVEKREHCRKCFAKWSCGGDCYYKWRAGSSSGEFNGSARCHIIREITKDQILEKIEAAGGIVWHDPVAWPEQNDSVKG